MNDYDKNRYLLILWKAAVVLENYSVQNYLCV